MSYPYNISPVVKIRTSDTTGYVIETFNQTTMGPSGCVTVTTREIWRLCANALSNGDLLAQTELQTALPENQNIPAVQLTKNEWPPYFGLNDQQPNRPNQGFNFFIPPPVLNISTSIKTVNSSEELPKRESLYKTNRGLQTEDASSEPNIPTKMDAESQTDISSETKQDCMKHIPGDSCSKSSLKPCRQGSRDSVNKNKACHNVSTQAEVTETNKKCACDKKSKKCLNCRSQTDLSGEVYSCHKKSDKRCKIKSTCTIPCEENGNQNKNDNLKNSQEGNLRNNLTNCKCKLKIKSKPKTNKNKNLIIKIYNEDDKDYSQKNAGTNSECSLKKKTSSSSVMETNSSSTDSSVVSKNIPERICPSCIRLLLRRRKTIKDSDSKIDTSDSNDGSDKSDKEISETENRKFSKCNSSEKKNKNQEDFITIYKDCFEHSRKNSKNTNLDSKMKTNKKTNHYFYSSDLDEDFEYSCISLDISTMDIADDSQKGKTVKTKSSWDNTSKDFSFSNNSWPYDNNTSQSEMSVESYNSKRYHNESESSIDNNPSKCRKQWNNVSINDGKNLSDSSMNLQDGKSGRKCKFCPGNQNNTSQSDKTVYCSCGKRDYSSSDPSINHNAPKRRKQCNNLSINDNKNLSDSSLNFQDSKSGRKCKFCPGNQNISLSDKTVYCSSGKRDNSASDSSIDNNVPKRRNQCNNISINGTKNLSDSSMNFQDGKSGRKCKFCARNQNNTLQSDKTVYCSCGKRDYSASDASIDNNAPKRRKQCNNVSINDTKNLSDASMNLEDDKLGRTYEFCPRNQNDTSQSGTSVDCSCGKRDCSESDSTIDNNPSKRKKQCNNVSINDSKYLSDSSMNLQGDKSERKCKFCPGNQKHTQSGSLKDSGNLNSIKECKIDDNDEIYRLLETIVNFHNPRFDKQCKRCYDNKSCHLDSPTKPSRFPLCTKRKFSDDKLTKNQLGSSTDSIDLKSVKKGNYLCENNKYMQSDRFINFKQQDSNTQKRTSCNNQNYIQSDSSTESVHHKCSNQNNKCNTSSSHKSSKNCDIFTITDSSQKSGGSKIDACKICLTKEVPVRLEQEEKISEVSNRKDSGSANHSCSRDSTQRTVRVINEPNQSKFKTLFRECQSSSVTKSAKKDSESAMEIDINKKCTCHSSQKKGGKHKREIPLTKASNIGHHESNTNILKKDFTPSMDVDVKCCCICSCKLSQTNIRNQQCNTNQLLLRNKDSTKQKETLETEKLPRICQPSLDISSVNKFPETMMDIDLKRIKCQWPQIDVLNQKDQGTQSSTRCPNGVKIHFKGDDHDIKGSYHDDINDNDEGPSIRKSIKNFLTRYLWGDPLTIESSTQVEENLLNNESDIVCQNEFTNIDLKERRNNCCCRGKRRLTNRSQNCIASQHAVHKKMSPIMKLSFKEASQLDKQHLQMETGTNTQSFCVHYFKDSSTQMDYEDILFSKNSRITEKDGQIDDTKGENEFKNYSNTQPILEPKNKKIKILHEPSECKFRAEPEFKNNYYSPNNSDQRKKVKQVKISEEFQEFESLDDEPIIEDVAEGQMNSADAKKCSHRNGYGRKQKTAESSTYK